MLQSYCWAPNCVVSGTFVCCSDPKLSWSIGRTNCLYHSTRVDLFSHKILFDGPNSIDVEGIRITLQWRHNGRDCVSNHQRLDCLLNRLSRRKAKKTSKHRVTGLCDGTSLVTDEFPLQRASNAGNVSIWWRHHGNTYKWKCLCSMLMTSLCGWPFINWSCLLYLRNLWSDYHQTPPIDKEWFLWVCGQRYGPKSKIEGLK